MNRATQPTIIHSAILKAEALIYEAVRCGTLSKSNEMIKELVELSKQGGSLNENKRVKVGKGCVLAVHNKNGPDQFRNTCPKLNRAHGQVGNYLTIKGNKNPRNKGNKARGKAFNVNAVEAHQDPNIVMGTFSLNGHFATLLFDSGADFSFISTEFVPLLNMEHNILRHGYLIEVANGKKVETDRIIRGCILKLGDFLFTIDLIRFGHGSFDVIVGMDWLSKHKAEIVCHEKVVRIPLASGKSKEEHKVHLKLVSELLKKDKYGYKKYTSSGTWLTAMSSVKDKILVAQKKVSKENNMPAEMLRSLDQHREKKEDDGLYFMDRVWVPLVGNVRTLIMDEAHATRYFIHPRADKMYHDMRDMYWWLDVIEGIGDTARYEKSRFIGPEMVQETTDKVILIKEMLKETRNRQKSYVDNRSKPLKFEVGDQVLLKVSPWKGVVHFGIEWHTRHIPCVKSKEVFGGCKSPCGIGKKLREGLKLIKVNVVRVWKSKELFSIVTSTCCDDAIHVTPRVFVLAGCDMCSHPKNFNAMYSAFVVHIEAGESSAAAVARPIEGRRADYGFFGSVEAEIRRWRVEDIGYGIRDTWIDPRDVAEEEALTTLEGVNTRGRQTEIFQRVEALVDDSQYHYETGRLVDQEAIVSREAWAHSIGLSSAVHFELQGYMTHTWVQDQRIDAQDTLIATLTTQLSSLQGHLATALGEIRVLQTREQARTGAPEGASSST
nr:reverse transcriptase domain-containing protein [Tanacetum cinerariifolium]